MSLPRESPPSITEDNPDIHLTDLYDCLWCEDTDNLWMSTVSLVSLSFSSPARIGKKYFLFVSLFLSPEMESGRLGRLTSPWCLSIPQVSLERHPWVKITAFERDSWVNSWADSVVDGSTHDIALDDQCSQVPCRWHLHGYAVAISSNMRRDRSACALTTVGSLAS